MKAKALVYLGLAICVLSLSRYREIRINKDTLSVNRLDAWGLSYNPEIEIKVSNIRDITVTNYYAGIADGGSEMVSDLCLLLGDGNSYLFPSEFFSTTHHDHIVKRQNALREGMKQGTYRRVAFAAWPFAVMGTIFAVLGMVGMIFSRKKKPKQDEKRSNKVQEDTR